MLKSLNLVFMHIKVQYCNSNKNICFPTIIWQILILRFLLLDFILVCDTVQFLHEESRYIGASIDHSKHREFTILLLLQVIPWGTIQFYMFLWTMLQSLTVSLQGFLNALVYGWTRQDFVVELKLRHTYSLTEVSSKSYTCTHNTQMLQTCMTCL